MTGSLFPLLPASAPPSLPLSPPPCACMERKAKAGVRIAAGGSSSSLQQPRTSFALAPLIFLLSPECQRKGGGEREKK